MVEVDRLVTCQLLGFDNLFQGRLNSHSMAPQGNLHVSGQGGCGPEDASHLQFLGRPEQQGSVRESACAHPRRVRLNISCHNLSSDNFAYHAPPPPFFGPIIFLPGPFLVGGSCRRFSGPDLDQKVDRVGLELTDCDEENWKQAQPPTNSHRCFRRCCFLARCRTPTEGWVVGAGIRQCAAGLTFGAGHGIRCGCGTRRKVSAGGSRRNHWGSSTSRLGLGKEEE